MVKLQRWWRMVGIYRGQSFAWAWRDGRIARLVYVIHTAVRVISRAWDDR